MDPIVNDILEFLKHPLVLIIVSGFISSVIIPHVTNKWQDHKRELEIKTNLLTKMSGSLSMGLIQSHNFRMYGKNSVSNMDKSDWIVTGYALVPELGIYFSDKSISKNWKDMMGSLTTFWQITLELSTSKSEFFNTRLENFKNGLDQKHRSELDQLKTGNDSSWAYAFSLLEEEGNKFIEMVMSMPIEPMKKKNNFFQRS